MENVSCSDDLIIVYAVFGHSDREEKRSRKKIPSYYPKYSFLSWKSTFIFRVLSSFALSVFVSHHLASYINGARPRSSTNTAALQKQTATFFVPDSSSPSWDKDRSYCRYNNVQPISSIHRQLHWKTLGPTTHVSPMEAKRIACRSIKRKLGRNETPSAQREVVLEQLRDPRATCDRRNELARKEWWLKPRANIVRKQRK